MKFNGLNLFKTYKKQWLSKDLIAGLSVAAIAMPVGIAYAGIAGLPLQTGLYSCILPMIIYALFGSSRQLIVGPDSATCILVAAAISPLAAAGSDSYVSLSIMLALMTGILSIVFAVFRLDFIANFLSKPILNGYLNGLAISIIVGQFGKVFGFDLKPQGIFRMLYEFISKIPDTHLTTFAFGLTVFILLRVFKKFLPVLPAPFLFVAAGIIIVYLFDLGKSGMSLVGSIPSGFPSIGIPAFDLSETGDLFVKSLGIVLISYCSFMLTNKSFAAKNGYQINANQDLYALGFANISSGLSQGFVISGADSRTAVADNAGGKSQMTSIIASLIIVMVLLFFTETLKYLPVAILGAIVISASIGLFNFEYLKNLYLVSRPEFYLAVITSLCVLTIGVLPAVIFAVCLSLLVLLARASKPHDAILGRSVDKNTYIDIQEDSGVKSIPGLLIYRFDAQLLFFNADYFRERINHYINKSEDKIDCLIIDAETIVLTDITGAEILSELISGLNNRGITVFIARSKFKFNSMIHKTGIDKKAKVFRTVHEAADHYLETVKNNS
ncbi:MAG: SulP family inorganic anion transporter [Ignavibacteria bacterium]|nr:SulP family inorganic anion transporter [Ignavibacteria bacterium]